MTRKPLGRWDAPSHACEMPSITPDQAYELWTCPVCHVICEAQPWEDRDGGSVVRTGIEWVKVDIAHA